MEKTNKYNLRIAAVAAAVSIMSAPLANIAYAQSAAPTQVTSVAQDEADLARIESFIEILLDRIDSVFATAENSSDPSRLASAQRISDSFLDRINSLQIDGNEIRTRLGLPLVDVVEAPEPEPEVEDTFTADDQARLERLERIIPRRTARIERLRQAAEASTNPVVQARRTDRANALESSVRELEAELDALVARRG